MEINNYKTMDPYMLLSIVNLKLRDFYTSLDSLCDDLNIDKVELEKTLKEKDFEYIESVNQFK
ncbi:DUF4250 domain-containing protein [uncultured Clostridium sp.]|jgi:hypothetical protein|uniref:DUF4250 domain-containing protein n=1 Tax=uncultured Clostridium sp. TaxID=59620 RepID=UPI0026186F34|nr:DUF4250 domain-containing protein [uncultured Clostridium sp.]